MGNSKLLISAAAVVALGIATPSFAQSTSAGSNVNGAAGDHSDTKVTTTNKTDVFAPTFSPSQTKTSTSTSTKTTTLDVSLSDSSQHNNSSQRNGNVHLAADQELSQSVSNESELDLGGRRSNYSSGANSISGSAFAAYSGILNQGWNTGISSNVQSATNIAAQGQTTFSQ